MKNNKKNNERKIKISITINPSLNKKMESAFINKSKLIEKLLLEYYGNKDLL